MSSGGYYRDHNLLAFSRNAMAGGVLSPIQNIDVYNTSANRVLPRYVRDMVEEGRGRTWVPRVGSSP